MLRQHDLFFLFSISRRLLQQYLLRSPAICAVGNDQVKTPGQRRKVECYLERTGYSYGRLLMHYAALHIHDTQCYNACLGLDEAHMQHGIGRIRVALQRTGISYGRYPANRIRHITIHDRNPFGSRGAAAVRASCGITDNVGTYSCWRKTSAVYTHTAESAARRK
jgi:hypothetical protein